MALSPMVSFVLSMACIFGGLGTILMILSAATDNWETSEWDSKILSEIETIDLSLSDLDDDNGVYKIALVDPVSTNVTYHIVRATYGGIWRICDRISDEAREKWGNEASWLADKCYYYIAEYYHRKDELSLGGDNLEDAGPVKIFRMQNSAASCTIVSLMCLATAAIIGGIGMWQKQVSACMVAGVMYIVAAVFTCFALVVMLTKLSYMRPPDCHSLDPGLTLTPICNARVVTFGWSIPVGWGGFGLFLLGFIFWLLVSRYVRLERSKSMI